MCYAAACGQPEMCEAFNGGRPYGNGDRMDDVEAHRPMEDGGATYLNDGER